MHSFRTVPNRGSQALHHADPVDADDFDSSVSHGNAGDCSLHIVAFRNGLRSGPLRDVLNPELVSVAVVPDTCIGLVIYEHPEHGPMCVGVAHVDAFGNVGMVSVNARFEQMVERLKGKVAA